MRINFVLPLNVCPQKKQLTRGRWLFAPSTGSSMQLHRARSNVNVLMEKTPCRKPSSKRVNRTCFQPIKVYMADGKQAALCAYRLCGIPIHNAPSCFQNLRRVVSRIAASNAWGDIKANKSAQRGSVPKGSVPRGSVPLYLNDFS